MHALAAVLRGDVVANPIGHGVQLEAPAAAYVPATQSEQTSAPMAEYVPATQAAHEGIDVAPNEDK